MDNKFPGYYKYKPHTFNKIWEDCHFVFESNVLLSLYILPIPLVDFIIKIMDSIKKQLWMPYIIANKYHYSIPFVIQNRIMKYESILSTLRSFRNNISSFNFITQENHIKLNDIFNIIEYDFIRENNRLLKLYTNSNSIKFLIAELYKYKVSESGTSPNPKSIYISGELDDNSKETQTPSIKGANNFNDQNTDLKNKDKDKEQKATYERQVWKSLINESREKCKPTIYISLNYRDKWSLFIDNEYIGPSPQMIDNFISESGQNYYSYNLYDFLTEASKRLSISFEDLKEYKDIIKKCSVDIETENREED